MVKKNSFNKKSKVKRLKQRLKGTNALVVSRASQASRINKNAFGKFQRRMSSSRFAYSSLKFAY